MEIHNGGIIHASNHSIDRFDNSQRHFLENLGVAERYASLKQNLAPPSLRRNIGVLGLLHNGFRNEPPYLSTFAAVSRGCVWIAPSRGTHAAVIWTRVTSSGAAFLACSFHFWDGVCLQPPTARVGGLCNCLQFPERSYPHGTENV